MRKYVVLILLGVSVLSCKQQAKKNTPVVSIEQDTIQQALPVDAPEEEPEEEPEESKEMDLDSYLAAIEIEKLVIDSSRFLCPYALDTFNTNDEWFERARDASMQFRPDKEEILRLEQNPDLDTPWIYIENYAFVSIQHNSNLLKAITVLICNEYCCCNLYYLLYDEKNRLINKQVLAGSGADGGVTVESFGHYLPEGLYQKINLSYDYDIQECWEEQNCYDFDSTVSYYTVFDDKRLDLMHEERFPTRRVHIQTDTLN